MNISALIVAAVIVSAIVLPSLASSHNAQQSVTVGSYTIEFSAEPLPAVGQRSSMVVAVDDNQLEKRVSDLTAFLRLSHGGTVLYASDVSVDESGAAIVTYAFQQPGDYALDVRVDELNLSATFRFNVPGVDAALLPVLVIGIIVGALALYFGRDVVVAEDEEERISTV